MVVWKSDYLLYFFKVYGQQRMDSLLAHYSQATSAYESFLTSPYVLQAVAPIDKLLEPLQDVANFAGMHASLPGATIRYLLAGFLVYPVAALTRFLPSRELRDFWMASIGALTAYFVFGRAWASLFYSALFSYTILSLKAIPNRHILVVVFSFAYLVVRQWGRASQTNEDMDDSVLHLVAVVKLFSLAFAVNDGVTVGGRIEKVKAKLKDLPSTGGDERQVKKVAELNAELKKLEGFEKRSIKKYEYPDLLSFFGYVLNFTTVLGGPAFDYREYRESQARESMSDVGVSRIFPAFTKFLQGTLYLAFMGVLLPVYNTEGLYRMSAWKGDPFNPAGVNVVVPSGSSGEEACRVACLDNPSLCSKDVVSSFFGYFDFPGSLRHGYEFKPSKQVIVPFSRPTEYVTVDPKFNCIFFSAPKEPFEDFLSFAFYTIVTLFIVRVQYYAVWKLAEGSCVLAGFGYRDVKKVGETRRLTPAGKLVFGEFLWFLSLLGISTSTLRSFLQCVCCSRGSKGYAGTLGQLGVFLPDDEASPDWEGVSNVNPFTMETRVSMKDSISNWNSNVQAWLVNYVFLRFPKLGVNANKWVTMLTSAFWHGFFPGYYLAFMTAPFIQETTSTIYTSWGKITAALFGWKLRDVKSGGDGCQFPNSSLWVLPRIMWILARWLGVLFSFCYSLGPFCLLKFNMGIAFWTYLGFVGHLAPLAFSIISSILATILVPRKQKAASSEKNASEPTPTKVERSSRNSKKE